MDTCGCRIPYSTRDAIDRAFTPSSWLSKYNRLKYFGVAHIALPYKTTGDICLSNIFNDKLTDTLPGDRIARNTMSAILEALSMRSDIIYFKFKLWVIGNPKYCLDLTHSISALPHLKFLLTKWLFDSTIYFVLLAITYFPHLAQYPTSLSKHPCILSLDVDISNKSSAYDILLNDMFFNTIGSQLVKVSCSSFWNIFDDMGLMQRPCFTPSEADIVSVTSFHWLESDTKYYYTYF